MKSDWKVIHVSSGFGANTREPFVEIQMEYPLDHPLQLHPDEAREFATNLLQAAEAADQDQFIFEFFENIMGEGTEKGLQAGGKALIEFRNFRDERRGRQG